MNIQMNELHGIGIHDNNGFLLIVENFDIGNNVDHRSTFFFK
jgi:hypothetical protein